MSGVVRVRSGTATGVAAGLAFALGPWIGIHHPPPRSRRTGVECARVQLCTLQSLEKTLTESAVARPAHKNPRTSQLTVGCFPSHGVVSAPRMLGGTGSSPARGAGRAAAARARAHGTRTHARTRAQRPRHAINTACIACTSSRQAHSSDSPSPSSHHWSIAA